MRYPPFQINCDGSLSKYCQKLDFEADPNNKFKPLIKKTSFFDSKSIKFPFITQLDYCQKLDFEADPNKFKPLIKQNYFFSIQNQSNFLV